MSIEEQVPWMPASDLVALTSTGQISVIDVANIMIERLNTTNAAINAVVDFDPEQTRADAAALDENSTLR